MSPKRIRNRENRIAKRLITFVVLMLVIVVSVKCVELREKRNNYISEQAYLEEQIEEEELRAEDIKEYETYTQTKAYVEEIARDKLGLVYEGEILFRDENQSR